LFFLYPWYAEYRFASVLNAEQFRLPLDDMGCCARQIASALKVLKARKIVHGNISADCWFVTRRSEMRLLDFSWAQKVGATRLELWEVRTIHECVTPEVLMGNNHLTSATDAWAFGCILF
jgi:serine/threonine protein kinase